MHIFRWSCFSAGCKWHSLSPSPYTTNTRRSSRWWTRGKSRWMTRKYNEILHFLQLHLCSIKFWVFWQSLSSVSVRFLTFVASILKRKLRPLPHFQTGQKIVVRLCFFAILELPVAGIIVSGAAQQDLHEFLRNQVCRLTLALLSSH